MLAVLQTPTSKGKLQSSWEKPPCHCLILDGEEEDTLWCFFDVYRWNQHFQELFFSMSLPSLLIIILDVKRQRRPRWLQNLPDLNEFLNHSNTQNQVFTFLLMEIMNMIDPNQCLFSLWRSPHSGLGCRYSNKHFYLIESESIQITNLILYF